MNSHAIEREVPVYREAFPSYFDKDIKLLKVHKKSFNKLNSMQGDVIIKKKGKDKIKVLQSNTTG